MSTGIDVMALNILVYYNNMLGYTFRPLAYIMQDKYNLLYSLFGLLQGMEQIHN